MSQVERKSSQSRQSAEDELKKNFVMMNILAISGLVFMGSMTALVHFDVIRLYPTGMNVNVVSGYGSRIEYAMRYQTLLVTWLMFNIIATISSRYKHRAANPLNESTEVHIQMHKNILTNSFEQISLSIFAQLIFVSFAQPECVLKYVPLINIVQFVGRLAFFAGYPMKRSFGFVCTALPTILVVIYNFVKFFAFVFNM